MVFCPGSGGWSAAETYFGRKKELPKFQLYDLAETHRKRICLWSVSHEVDSAMTRLMGSYIENGRSIQGKQQRMIMKALV